MVSFLPTQGARPQSSFLLTVTSGLDHRQLYPGDQSKGVKGPKFLGVADPIREGGMAKGVVRARSCPGIGKSVYTYCSPHSFDTLRAQRTATRIPNTIPTSVAREVACRNTLRRAAGKSPCGSAR